MVTVTVGADTYGRVKCVCGTPIVTKFAMLNSLPIYPLKSFYFTGSGPTEVIGNPFVESSHAGEAYGIQLAKVDLTSAIMAYVRGLFALLILAGFTGVLFPGIMFLNGEQLDDFAMAAFRWLAASLAIGVVGGIFTYVMPHMTKREVEIRRNCRELLGIAIDPARLPSHTAMQIVENIDRLHDSIDDGGGKLIRDLVCARVKIAHGVDVRLYESVTDDLLWQLRRATELA
jgi:hypothetical protein